MAFDCGFYTEGNWTEILFQVSECYLKHLTILEPCYLILWQFFSMVYKIISSLIRRWLSITVTINILNASKERYALKSPLPSKNKSLFKMLTTRIRFGPTQFLREISLEEMYRFLIICHLTLSYIYRHAISQTALERNIEFSETFFALLLGHSQRQSLSLASSHIVM